ncbi:Cof-type HAD-IIB family hydrolase [Blastococcus atacamensis]|uniref:HAD family hydrolase n=1 Tax=Blastococcus atacamensis TaxID=2070508 RepID=UPI000CECB50C|nr:HAD family hydrolase [Blastococcus atacamensis]
MTGPVLVTTDLDRTLIFSPRATEQLGGGLPRSVVEVLEGRVVSEMADVVRDGLAQLGRFPAAVSVVPTTTRTPRQLQRVDLPFTPRFLIAGSGGVVLEHGRVDEGWARATARRLAGCAPVTEVRAVLDALVADGTVLRAHTAEDLFCYGIVDPARFGAEEAERLTARLLPRSWRVAHQGTKVYALPDALHKAHAIGHVRGRMAEELGDVPELLAAGDTWLDAEMLELADRGWVPAGSEIARTGLPPWPHVTLTGAPGHAAAAEIVAAWQAHVLGTSAAGERARP